MTVPEETMVWVESAGGPLIAVPESALPQWRGCPTTDGPVRDWGDYGRVCGVDGYIGLLPVGGSQALVLGDMPAPTTYLPDHRLFVRWVAADSEQEILAEAIEALPRATWEETLSWEVREPLLVFDSALRPDEIEASGRLRVEVPAGRYRVRAAYLDGDRATCILTSLGPE